jgi:hypothetical protein
LNRRFLIIAAVPLLALLVACGGGKKGNASATATPSSGKTPAATVAASGSSGSSTGATGTSGATGASSSPVASGGGGGGPNGDLLATVLTNFANAKSWKARIDDPLIAAQSASFVYVAPDKYDITVGDNEALAIGSDTYIRNGGVWIKTPATSTGSGGLFNPGGVEASIEAAKAAVITKGATDTVNGIQCQIYSYSDGTANYDICVADNLPLRIVRVAGESKSTITFSDFNGDFDIKRPI